MPIEIIRVTDPEIIQQIGRLRADVWSAEGKLDNAKITNGVWLDELDYYEHTTQYAAMHHGEVVAAARLSCHFTFEDMPHEEDFSQFDLRLKLPYAYISRLIVHKDFRGRGLAQQLDSLRLHDAANQGADATLALPICYRVESLRKLGFVYFGTSSIDALERDDNGLIVPVHVMVHYMENLLPQEPVKLGHREP